MKGSHKQEARQAGKQSAAGPMHNDYNDTLPSCSNQRRGHLTHSYARWLADFPEYREAREKMKWTLQRTYVQKSKSWSWNGSPMKSFFGQKLVRDRKNKLSLGVFFFPELLKGLAVWCALLVNTGLEKQWSTFSIGWRIVGPPGS